MLQLGPLRLVQLHRKGLLAAARGGTWGRKWGYCRMALIVSQAQLLVN
jgi:hypothetical protein